MLTEKEARKIGVNACIDKLGRSFVDKHQDHAVFSYGETDEGMYCYVGVSDEPPPEFEPGVLVLDSVSPWKYHASCTVSLDTGALTFQEVVCPRL